MGVQAPADMQPAEQLQQSPKQGCREGGRQARQEAVAAAPHLRALAPIAARTAPAPACRAAMPAAWGPWAAARPRCCPPAHAAARRSLCGAAKLLHGPRSAALQLLQQGRGLAAKPAELRHAAQRLDGWRCASDSGMDGMNEQVAAAQESAWGWVVGRPPPAAGTAQPQRPS